MTTATHRHVPVLIVGGGPVGMSMGLALARLGVPAHIVERSPGTTVHPKSRGCWVRTMEIFRQWGVEQAIRARGLPDGSDVFAYFDPITRQEIGRTTPEPRGDESPTWKCLVAQDAVEEALLAGLVDVGVTQIDFGTECVDVTDVGTHVEARIRDVERGTEEVWTADWLVAADGAGSGIRRSVGIEMVGPAVIAVMTNEYVRVDLTDLPVAKGAAGIFCVPSDGDRQMLGFLNTDGERWLMGTRVGTTEDERDRPFNDEEVAEMVRWYLGVPDHDVTRINSSTWRMSNQVAATFRQGRVLLAGDAAHRFPITGGFGLNSGVQDAHNLAWKLAFVLAGHADSGLLDTYDTERRPVAQSNAAFSFDNSQRLMRVHDAARSGLPGQFDFWIDDLDNHLHNVGQSLGFVYEDGAVLPDGSTPPPRSSRYYTPSDRPGGRFPHLWAEVGTSTLDWFDDSFVLVTGQHADDWRDAAAAVAEATGMPLSSRMLPEAGPGAGCHLGPRGAALVRPDGHVAWRTAWSCPDPEAMLGDAVRQLLGRD